MKSLTLLGIALAWACSAEPAPEPDPDPDPLPPAEECAGIECLPCFSGEQCADADEHIEGTCCADGDSLVGLATGRGAEVVDIESNGTYAFLCGGFGVRINDIAVPSAPAFVGSASSRCQNAAIGATLQDGAVVFYLAHHGDSWVETPFLRTYRLSTTGDAANAITEVHAIEDPAVLFEGMQWHGGYLYVAAHAGGVRVYDTDDGGIPTLVHTVAGFDNAWKLDVHGDTMYVVDANAGLVVLSLADPARPQIVQQLGTTGGPRDVDYDDGRVFVALGGSGVDVFDAADPQQLVPSANIDTDGSAMAVSADDGIVAVAAWSHVAVYDAASLLLLGTERTREYPDFEQDVGIVTHDGVVLVGEWEALYILRYRPGYVAPDLWLDDDTLFFPSADVDAHALIVRNRGRRELRVDDIVLSEAGAFTVDTTSLRLGPGGAGVVEVTYTPPPPVDVGPPATMTLITNDPDDGQAAFTLPLITSDSSRIDVGDKLTDDFAFLDPSGAGQLDGLEGKVVVLAYFALF